MRRIRFFSAMAAVPLLISAFAVSAQEAEPGWAKGRPKTDTAMKMAPVPAFPIPTAVDQLPTKKFKLPPGFKVETWASGVLDARELRQGPPGTIIVSTLFVGNKVYSMPEAATDGNRKATVIIDKTEQATGIEYKNGSLFFATHKQIVRYDNVDGKLGGPLGEPTKVLKADLPGGSDHSWKYLRASTSRPNRTLAALLRGV